MWMFSGLGVSATASQVTGTGLSGFPLATRLQRDSGNTGTSSVLYGQTIETSNCQDLAGQTVSVSFYARAGSNYSGATNSLLVYVGTGSGTDQGLNSFIGQTWTSQVFNLIGTATLTTSWQRFTFNFAVPAGTNEITPYVTQVPLGTAGANDFFDITGVQLEAGSTATDFERRPIGTELALCQRYFQSYGGLSSTDNICMGASLSTTVCVGFVQLPVSMRTSPSIGFTSVNAVVLDDNGAAVISNNILTSTSGTTSVYLSIPSTTTAGLTANRPARMSVNGINARVTWSAEL
jgi:hypothetical protein